MQVSSSLKKTNIKIGCIYSIRYDEVGYCLHVPMQENSAKFYFAATVCFDDYDVLNIVRIKEDLLYVDFEQYRLTEEEIKRIPIRIKNKLVAKIFNVNLK